MYVEDLGGVIIIPYLNSNCTCCYHTVVVQFIIRHWVIREDNYLKLILHI